MSFAAIRATATSALTASQLRTQVAAANIANADTAGYSTKSVTQVATLYGTLATGVSVTAITSAMNKYLLSDVVSAASIAGAAEVTANVADALQSSLGTTSSSDGSGSSLAQSLAELETAASALVASPDSDVLKASLVSALDSVTNQLNATAESVQNLRGQVDQAIDDSVDTVNEALQTIADLNVAIQTAKGRNDSTAELEDQRNLALQTVAAQLAVNYFVNSAGAMRVSTSAGATLVDSTAHLLSYSASAVASTETVFSGLTLDGKDISDSIAGGAIGSLLAARDETLVGVSAELDALAAGVIGSVNAAYSAIAGEELLTGSDAGTIAVRADILAKPATLAVANADEANRLVAALTDSWDFLDAGSIAAGARNFADYATVLVGNAATASTAASSRNEMAQSTLSSAQNAMSSATGVNLDEETAKLSELEQYYSVAAQILTTLNAMFDSLLQAAKSA